MKKITGSIAVLFILIVSTCAAFAADSKDDVEPGWFVHSGNFAVIKLEGWNYKEDNEHTDLWITPERGKALVQILVDSNNEGVSLDDYIVEFDKGYLGEDNLFQTRYDLRPFELESIKGYQGLYGGVYKCNMLKGKTFFFKTAAAVYIFTISLPAENYAKDVKILDAILVSFYETGRANDTDSEKSNLKTNRYSHADAGFSLIIPPGWQEIESVPDVAATFEIIEPVKGLIQISASMLAKDSDLEKFMQKCESTLVGSNGLFEGRDSLVRKTVNGHDAFVCQYHGTVQGQHVKGKHAYMAVNDKGYLIGGLFPVEDYQDGVKGFDELLKTFSVDAVSQDTNRVRWFTQAEKYMFLIPRMWKAEKPENEKVDVRIYPPDGSGIVQVISVETDGFYDPEAFAERFYHG